MSKAIILGAAAGSGNIGDAVHRRLQEEGWETYPTSCMVNNAYAGIPPLSDHDDAGALVVTLGKTMIKPFWEVTEDEITEVIAACLIEPLIEVREYVAVRERKGAGGRIVLTGSYAHRHPFTNGTAYCAAKAGLHMAARTLGWELTDRGFDVFIVHPYHVEGTPMWEQVQEGVQETKGWTREEADEYARKDLKLPAPCRAEDVAEIVRGLLVNPAASWLSGSAVELFGGVR